MSIEEEYDKLQLLYGDKSLNSVYGGGCKNEPRLCLVFMNPTARNITAQKDWQGVRYPWLSTKQIWSFFTKCNLIDEELNSEIQAKKTKDWTPEFCERVYDVVSKQKIYITNLGKCTQKDARPLPNSVFRQYEELLLKEIANINPQRVVLFGNQVSSILLNDSITVSTCRRKEFKLCIDEKEYPTYSVFYPVGNGRFNIDKAIEDLTYISKL